MIRQRLLHIGGHGKPGVGKYRSFDSPQDEPSQADQSSAKSYQSGPILYFPENEVVNSRPQRRVSGPKVILDVGGTRFVTCESTLSLNSNYFKALFASRQQPNFKPIAIDQDPETFAVLLTYMRSGVIDIPTDDAPRYRLRVVLKQAQLFGVNGFLTSVKATAFKRINQRSDFGKNERAEAEEFDKKYGSLDNAIALGVLPHCFFPPSDTIKIRLDGNIFCMQKDVLIKGSSFFQKALESDPLHRWKEQIVASGNADVFRFVLHFISLRTFDFISLYKMVKSYMSVGHNEDSSAKAPSMEKIADMVAVEITSTMVYLGVSVTTAEIDNLTSKFNRLVGQIEVE